MNYQTHYNNLVSRAQLRTLVGYVEKHHIIPICMGGAKDKSNIVRLTPEEHYVAHQLLVKIHPGNLKLLWAASNMTIQTRTTQRNNKLYGWLRRKLAKALSARFKGKPTGKKGYKHTAEARRKMSEKQKLRIITEQQKDRWRKVRVGATLSEEHKEKIRLANSGVVFSAERRKKISAATKGKLRGPQAEWWKRKRSDALKGRTLSDEHKKRIGLANKIALAGVKWTEERNQKISIRMKQIWAERRMIASGARRG